MKQFLPASFLVVLLVLVYEAHSAPFIPTHLECGSASEVFEVTKYPFSITSPLSDASAIVISINESIANVLISFVVESREESYLRFFPYQFSEINSSSTDYDPIAYRSYDIQNTTWEVSAIRKSDCAGIYLKTVLANGGIIEITWNTYQEDHEYAYGTRTFTSKKSAAKYRFLVKNYPFTYPGQTSLYLESFIGYSQPFDNKQGWAIHLGDPNDPAAAMFPKDPVEPNVTLTVVNVEPTSYSIGMTQEERGYDLSDIVNINQYANNAILNDDQETHVFLRGAVYETAGTRLNSLIFSETFSGNFSDANDVLYYDIRSAQNATVTLVETQDSGVGQLHINWSILLLFIISLLSCWCF
eukprot:TRINITY_DN11466_c0_g1_i1.p1 TRINITY_DN11466_c0_g1~~TRINITY_DN11466_c0_g1_i1.p1  ORF type:complete len:356 (-),score=49.20 TRINITY_DN11466_c0_g1_i1:31-1098(-)